MVQASPRVVFLAYFGNSHESGTASLHMLPLLVWSQQSTSFYLSESTHLKFR